MMAKLFLFGLLVIFTNEKPEKAKSIPLLKMVKVNPKRQENNQNKPSNHKQIIENTPVSLPPLLPEDSPMFSKAAAQKLSEKNRKLQFWRRRRRGGRRGGRGGGRGGGRWRGHRNQPWVRPHWWLPDQHIPVNPNLPIQGIHHRLPDDARVNLFRVNCRLFNNCTHPSTRRSRTFHPEILSRSPRPILMSKGNEGPDPPLPSPDLDEDQLRRAVHDPTDELINHLTQFGRDRRVTLWVQSLFRQGRLPHDLNNLDLIDRNYFVGSHNLIGNTRISERRAIRSMNYEQYFRHKELTIGRAMNHQQLIADFANSKIDYRHMMTFRRQRQIVYESILQMENVIYMEQNSLIQNIKRRRDRFDQVLRNRIEKTMKELQGVIYYPMIFDRKDIFRDN